MCKYILDPRTEHFFLMSTPPIGIMLILAGYIILIKKGPKYMENREPYDLKAIMMVYNFMQVVLNLMLGISVRYYFNYNA